MTHYENEEDELQAEMQKEADSHFFNTFGKQVDTRKFALVSHIKYRTGNEWHRTFGPFDTRVQARSFKNKLLRSSLQEHSLEWLKENVRFEVTQYWELSN